MLSVTSITKNSALVKWNPPFCSDRNGELVYYSLIVFELPETYYPAIMENVNSSQNFFEITPLKPYKQYNVNVGYVNSQGEGPAFPNLLTFTTLQDGNHFLKFSDIKDYIYGRYVLRSFMGQIYS